MYNDFRHMSRLDWKYPYAGHELILAAQRKLATLQEKEMVARNELSKLIADPEISASDEKIEKLKKDVENFGSLEEQCRVFLYEFNRTPDGVFRLTLGDVVFFELMPSRKKNG